MAHKIQIFQQGFQKKITLRAGKGDRVLSCGRKSKHVLQWLEPPLLSDSECVTSMLCLLPWACPEEGFGPDCGPGGGVGWGGVKENGPSSWTGASASLELLLHEASPPALRSRSGAETGGHRPPVPPEASVLTSLGVRRLLPG